MQRIVEAYLGEYASGKSENALNRALELARVGREVTLVDLDLVEPCYTLRSLQDQLTERGVTVLAHRTDSGLGLGEAGMTLLPAARWALRRSGDIIFDIGYGVGGARILNLIEGAADDPDLQLVLVANFSRPIFPDAAALVRYARELGAVDGLLANTHLENETTPELVLAGLAQTEAAARALDVPLVAVALNREFAAEQPEFVAELQAAGRQVRLLERLMPQGFW